MPTHSNDSAKAVSPLFERFGSGAVAGPAFVVLSLVQVPLKEGFDMSRHAFSYLALGEHGWIQQANFVVAGMLFVAAALGLRQHLSGRLLVVAMTAGISLGLGMVVAGLFRVDPSFGFPQGAPAGRPEEISLSGALHGVGFGVSMTAWVVLLITLGMALRRAGDGLIAWGCFAVAAALPFVPALSGASFGTVYLYVVASTAFVFTSVVLARITSTAGRIYATGKE